ncbi:MerR family transcriptional regulator [Actinocorallia sp. A-T 12471]|uniref:MerR family transcriptional regulator n=1 Tax=Actinocorallia sp. A-T 12471 TaxID=3089813 RepID=UPI0029D102C1|nr:MerR family transcriptional regulator [Actinocorallia sp. A-T 12471]MDX6739588.1 MerR family transcriptional regulator [Actinocorallia sp. A-T 12471]
MGELYSITEVAERFGVSVPTLRYYEDIGLVPSSARRGRVRHYDRAALERLAYAQLWHHDGMMTLADTLATMRAPRAADRHARITAQLETTRARISRLERAAKVLNHLLDCPRDHPLDCPVTGAHIRARVDAIMSGEPYTEPFPNPADLPAPEDSPERDDPTEP